MYKITLTTFHLAPQTKIAFGLNSMLIEVRQQQARMGVPAAANLPPPPLPNFLISNPANAELQIRYTLKGPP